MRIRYQQICLMIFLAFLALSSCTTAPEAKEVPATETATISSLTAPTTILPVAQPLPEETVQNLEDEMAQQLLNKRREEAAAIAGGGNGIMLPRLVPMSPAQQLSAERLAIMSLPAEQRLQGYLDVVAEVEGHETHDFSLILLINGRQTTFKLGENEAPAHLLRLPSWQPQTFLFSLPEPLPPGLHELHFIIHDDPHGNYAERGVLEKQRREGKITFAAAAGRPFRRAFGVRHLLIVGDETSPTHPPVNWEVEPFTPQQTNLLGSPLLISLTEDETDPLIGIEPAVALESDKTLYAFVNTPTFPPELSGLVTAALVAILDNHQVTINGHETLSFSVQSDQHYRLPIQVEWPDAVHDGNIHQLFIGVLFAVEGEWQQTMNETASSFYPHPLPYFASPVMIAPELSLIAYIRSDSE